MARSGVIGVEKVVANAKKTTAEVKDAVKNVVAESALNIQREAKKRTPVDTGRLRSSIAIEFSDGLTATIGTNVEYAAAVEFGSQPHFPPPSALAGWARRHGMNGKEFVLARKIARRGTPAQPFLFPSFEQERPKFIANARRVVQ